MHDTTVASKFLTMSCFKQNQDISIMAKDAELSPSVSFTLGLRPCMLCLATLCVRAHFFRLVDTVTPFGKILCSNFIDVLGGAACLPCRLLQADLAAHPPVKLLNEPGKAQAGVIVHVWGAVRVCALLGMQAACGC